MFNVKELEDAIFAMQELKLPKGIKVTTPFWHYLESITPKYTPKLPKIYPAYYMGLPIEIDDEIDGYYEIIY